MCWIRSKRFTLVLHLKQTLLATIKAPKGFVCQPLGQLWHLVYRPVIHCFTLDAALAARIAIQFGGIVHSGHSLLLLVWSRFYRLCVVDWLRRFRSLVASWHWPLPNLESFGRLSTAALDHRLMDAWLQGFVTGACAFQSPAVLMSYWEFETAFCRYLRRWDLVARSDWLKLVIVTAAMNRSILRIQLRT